MREFPVAMCERERTHGVNPSRREGEVVMRGRCEIKRSQRGGKGTKEIMNKQKTKQEKKNTLSYGDSTKILKAAKILLLIYLLYFNLDKCKN